MAANPDGRRTWWVIVLVMFGGCAAFFGVKFIMNRPSRPTTLSEYHGMTRNRVLAELGEPDDRFDLSLDQIKDEFHVELHNYLDSQVSHRAGETVFVEWRWNDGEYYIALWFCQIENEWTVVDSIRWHESVRF